jgi:hypothetical protein
MTDTHPAPERRTRASAVLGLTLGLSALLLGACASTPPPTAQMAVANAAVSHAVGAGAVELAPAEMALARDKMNRANQAMKDKDHDGARALAEQAQLDAQLAEAKAEGIKAQKAATAMQEASRALREEMGRKAQ